MGFKKGQDPWNKGLHRTYSKETLDKICKEKNDRQKAYYAKNKEKINAKFRIWYAENQEKERARFRKYYAKHPPNSEENRARANAYFAANREKCIARQKDYYAKHRETLLANFKIYQATHREERQAYERLHTYGLSKEDFNVLLDKQGGGCAVCGKPDWNGKGPMIDHDHGPKKTVRGILCSNCNIALGHIHDNPKVARAMANYLEKYENGRGG